MKSLHRILVIILFLILLVSFNIERITYYYSLYKSRPIQKEFNMVKNFLKSTISEDEPKDDFKNIIISNQDYSQLFYSFKIWFIEAKISLKDIENSYPKFYFKENQRIGLNIHYKKNKPDIQSVLIYDHGKYKIKSIQFPLNNCFFNADKNNDNKIDRQDVLMVFNQDG